MSLPTVAARAGWRVMPGTGRGCPFCAVTPPHDLRLIVSLSDTSAAAAAVGLPAPSGCPLAAGQDTAGLCGGHLCPPRGAEGPEHLLCMPPEESFVCGKTVFVIWCFLFHQGHGGRAKLHYGRDCCAESQPSPAVACQLLDTVHFPPETTRHIYGAIASLCGCRVHAFNQGRAGAGSVTRRIISYRWLCCFRTGAGAQA